MNRFGLYGGVAAAVCMLAAGGARAQETTAGIDGAVRGADGRGAAGVTVQVLFAPQATRFTAVTDGSGRFSLRQLPVGGPYDVVATGPGGEARVRVDSLGLGSPLELTLDLAPAAAPVVVTARRARADTFKTGPRSSFTATDIQTLPTFGRDLKDIARLNPFVTIDPALAGAVQIAGNQGRLNTIYVDGVKQSDDFGLNDGGYPTQRSPISIDVVDSLNVEVAPYDVRYGSFQGGVLNIATKSGGNEFHGGGFFEYDSDHFGAGKRIRDQPIAITFKDKTYGLNLGGPIIPDRVFFEFGYEKLESLAPAGYGPAGAGLTNSIRGVTTADVTNVQNILQSRYGYDAGGFGTTQPTSDEKFFGKLEVKLTDRHRFVFEAQTDYGSQYRTPGDSVTGATLALVSDDYVLQQNLSAYTGFLYSNWTDHLSTELSYTHKDVATLTDNIGGDDFARFQVILPTGSSIVVGPDTFRHANILRNTDQLFRARANYSIGGNVITLGYEREQLDVFNLFNPRSNGVYTFGSVAAGVSGLTDLANGAAPARLRQRLRQREGGRRGRVERRQAHRLPAGRVAPPAGPDPEGRPACRHLPAGRPAARQPELPGALRLQQPAELRRPLHAAAALRLQLAPRAHLQPERRRGPVLGRRSQRLPVQQLFQRRQPVGFGHLRADQRRVPDLAGQHQRAQGRDPGPGGERRHRRGGRGPHQRAGA